MTEQHYSDDCPSPTMQELVADHLSLVAALAHRAYHDCKGQIDLEELISIGNQGLVEAASRYRSDVGAAFATYAYHRIRGSMLDAIRRASPLPRRVVRALRAGETVRERWRVQAPGRRSAGELADRSQTPADELLAAAQLRATLDDALSRLPERERTLVCEHYYDDATLTDAGRALGISKSRASRVHGRALGRLRGNVALKAFAEAA